MATCTTAWLIAAYHNLPAAAFDVDGGGDVNVATGSYYAYDGTAANSLADVVAAAIQTAPSVATCTASLLESGKIKLTMDGTTAVTWGSATTVRDLLGFSGNLSGASSYTATYVSPLFWSPGKTESPMRSVLGGTGADESDIAYRLAPTLYGGATEHNTRQVNTFIWRNIASAKFYSTSEANGEFYTWWSYAKKMANWKLYRNIAEDTAGSGAASLGTPLGPYLMDPREMPRNAQFPFARSDGFDLVDQFHPVSIDAVTTVEIDNS